MKLCGFEIKFIEPEVVYAIATLKKGRSKIQVVLYTKELLDVLELIKKTAIEEFNKE